MRRLLQDETIRDAIFEMSMQLQFALNDYESRVLLYNDIEKAEVIANGLLKMCTDTSIGHIELRRAARDGCQQIIEALRGDRVQQPIDLCTNIIKKGEEK